MKIYFDNAATTKPNGQVIQAMNEIANRNFYNSSALYEDSLVVKNIITSARQTVLSKLSKTNNGDIVFTSGATESNNMVIFGKVTAKRNHAIVFMGEHSSVFEPFKYLHDNGFEIDFVPLQSNGTVDLTALKGFVRENTSLLVFGLVNSDTGTIQDARTISSIVKTINPRVHIHCDATQGFCKLPFYVEDLGVDSIAISAHKIHGPKGIGGLWLKKGSTLRPMMYGGGQQNLRPGTMDTPSIVGFAKAVEVFNTEENFKHVSALHEYLVSNLPSTCNINGVNSNPYITNIQLPNGVMGQSVMNALDGNGIVIGLGSACSSSSGKNRTLSAMGHSDNKTKQVIRVSFSHENTIGEVSQLIEQLNSALKFL